MGSFVSYMRQIALRQKPLWKACAEGGVFITGSSKSNYLLRENRNIGMPRNNTRIPAWFAVMIILLLVIMRFLISAFWLIVLIAAGLIIYAIYIVRKPPPG